VLHASEVDDVWLLRRACHWSNQVHHRKSRSKSKRTRVACLDVVVQSPAPVTSLYDEYARVVSLLSVYVHTHDRPQARNCLRAVVCIGAGLRCGRTMPSCVQFLVQLNERSLRRLIDRLQLAQCRCHVDCYSCDRDAFQVLALLRKRGET